MSDLIDPMILFGQPGHGAGPCCSCCNGYCPRHPRPSVAQRMHREHAEAAMRSARRQS